MEFQTAQIQAILQKSTSLHKAAGQEKKEILMGTPTPDSTVSSGAGGQVQAPVTGQEKTPAEAVGALIVGGFNHAMATLMQIQGKEAQGVGGVGASQSTSTTDKAIDSSAYSTGATSGQLVNNPQLPTPDHATVEQGFEQWASQASTGEDAFGGAVVALNNLGNAVKQQAGGANSAGEMYNAQFFSSSSSGGAGGAGSAGSAGSAGGVGSAGSVRVGSAGSAGSEPLAGLAGNPMTALFSSMSEFAHEQSSIAKLASEVSIKEQKVDLENAQDQADIVQEKADIAIAADIVGIVAGVAIGAASIKSSMDTQKAVNSGKISDSVGQMQSTMNQAVTQMLNTVSEKGTDAIKTAETAPLEGEEIMLRAEQDIIKKAEQSMDKLQSDEDALCGNALDLIQKWTGSVTQSFGKIGV